MAQYDKAWVLVKKLSESQKVREQVMKAGGTVVLAAGKVGFGSIKGRVQRREHLRNAIQHARDIGGQYSKDVMVGGRLRQLVWRDGLAVYAYPALDEKELGGKPLAERLELQHFPRHLMHEPPQPTTEPHAGGNSGSAPDGAGETHVPPGEDPTNDDAGAITAPSQGGDEEP